MSVAVLVYTTHIFFAPLYAPPLRYKQPRVLHDLCRKVGCHLMHPRTGYRDAHVGGRAGVHHPHLLRTTLRSTTLLHSTHFTALYARLLYYKHTTLLQATHFTTTLLHATHFTITFEQVIVTLMSVAVLVYTTHIFFAPLYARPLY